MAYALAVASKPKSATSIGRGQAVSGHSKSGSLLGSLRNFSSHKVNISQSQQVGAKNVVREKLENLLSNLKENSKGVCSFDYQGSVYEGLKVGAADEFDISVALNGKKDIEPVNVVPGYALMKPIKKDDFRFKKYVTTDGYFSGVQFREKHFFSVVHKWANSMKDDRTNVKISAHGPAVQVDLAPPIGSGLPRKISVDLVPTFRISDGQHYVAKPYKPYAEVPQKLPCDTQLLWRQSFSRNERDILKTIDRDGGCRKQCTKILKVIRNEDATLRSLTSYHLKTELLHRCDVIKDWHSNKMDQRFLDMLGGLETHVRERNLPHYFIPELNLLDGYKESTLDNIAGRLNRLQHSEVERNKVLNR